MSEDSRRREWPGLEEGGSCPITHIAITNISLEERDQGLWRYLSVPASVVGWRLGDFSLEH